VPRNFLHDPLDVQQSEVLNENSTGGRSSYYRCENLTINYLTPLLVSAWIACGGVCTPPKSAYIVSEPLRHAVDVQGLFILLTGLVCHRWRS
jgi:hypothetical protein